MSENQKRHSEACQGVTCKYNAKKDMLVVDSAVSLDSCMFCHGQLRSIHNDGTVAYENGDITNEPVKNPMTNRCSCGFKHWWKGNAYDNPPQEIPVVLNWNSVSTEDVVYWFQYESNPTLNSNVYQIASYLLQKHFPGEFGSERLHQNLVQQILDRVKDLPAPSHPAMSDRYIEEACGGICSNIDASSNDQKNSEKQVEASTSNEATDRQNLPIAPDDHRPSFRVGPAVTTLSSTPLPADHSIEAMNRFLQMMRHTTPHSHLSPSTSKQ